MKPTKKLLNQLIKIYSKAIEEIKEGSWQAYLQKHNLQHGICYCASENFGTNPYEDAWVQKRLMRNFSYWAKKPSYADNVDEAKKLLAIRVKKLKEVLKSIS